MKAYIAGKLFKEEEKSKLEQVDKICKELNIDTYLPHRDMGVCPNFKESLKFFQRDRDEVDKCDFIIAVLDWKGISSGTAWEIGYAHAKNKKVIGLVEDLFNINNRLCVMCFNSVILVDSLEKLKQEIINLQ